MKHYALTGGIGSGKSTVCSMFERLGVPSFSADDSAKRAMTEDKKIVNQIKELFGNNAYKDEELNRSYIAQQVFSNKKKLNALNAIVHPAARAAYLKWQEEQTAPYTIYEFPIVFELQAQHQFDGVILVTAPEEDRISRVQKRDNNPREDVLARMKNQWHDDQKIPLAQFVIENRVLADTQKQVEKLHQTLIELSAR